MLQTGVPLLASLVLLDLTRYLVPGNAMNVHMAIIVLPQIKYLGNAHQDLTHNGDRLNVPDAVMENTALLVLALKQVQLLSVLKDCIVQYQVVILILFILKHRVQLVVIIV